MAPTSFRFESSSNLPLDERDDELLRLATIYGGRALTLITFGSLIFYIYVGLSVRSHPPTAQPPRPLPACLVTTRCLARIQGGITDGFDRFTEPIEDIRVTIEREGVNAIPEQRFYQ